jgi:hypothetical protein
MSIEIFREVALVAVFVAFVGVLLAAVTPRGLTSFEEAVRMPIGNKPFGRSEDGR